MNEWAHGDLTLDEEDFGFEQRFNHSATRKPRIGNRMAVKIVNTSHPCTIIC